MGANFISGSSQYLLNNPSLITAYPFTVGMWIRATTVGVNKCAWSNAVDTTNYWELWQFAANTWTFETNDGGGDADATGGSVVSGVWTFIVMRGISATNRRIATLLSTGAATHAQNTTSRTPTGIAQNNLGRSFAFASYFDGQIAEFWYTLTDIQPDGLALDDGLLRQLAYRGPFSVPSVGAAILSGGEYRSLFSSQGSITDKPGEVLWGGRGRQTWVNNGGVRVGLHPPLPPDYVRPDDVQSLAVI